MSLHRNFFFLTLILVFASVAGMASAAEVQRVRFSSNASRTRVVVDLDGAAEYKHWTLGDPPRVLVSLANGTVAEGLQTPTIQDGFVDRVRVNPTRDGRVQVVLDLSQAAEYQTFTLSNPARIIVDVSHMGGTPAPSKGKTPEPQPVTPDSSTPVKAEVSEPSAREVEKPAPRTVTPAQAPPRDGPWRIAVDAGHGGKDPGAIHNNLREKDVVLALARALVDELNVRPGIQAFLTRKGDYYIPLRTRWTMAQEQNADIFVSLHCDASERRDAKGTAVYFVSLKGATDEATRELAERENRYDQEQGLSHDEDDLDTILFDMAQTDVVAKSEILAETCIDKLFSLGTVYSRGVKQAGFAVLKSPSMPSILVESAFISNGEEARFLRDRRWQRNFGRYLADGIEAYCMSVENAE